ncbi:Gfo/Idh/MocA family oxidoreductase [Streptomyces sp. AK02-01A]|uniref:Gfo/Idh/MocA family protein n=1 Tax=Streptomyces sp. AK02-01A TaxID=3028648 RepID=UPI0029BBC52D|nr:Gfo/Idh/MocA family oxidoreductase [Streptomyces sp. AK02-01A]MDX3854323.1 Gfo/Idh/MocA family oxidoreductase [Streptomyces sp. AK02-01A]
MKKTGVGIIGAGAQGWASISHVPVIGALPAYELRAISTTRRESAEAAARKFGVGAAFDNHHDLIAHPGVDLVVVSVKVPEHHRLISAALDAGKMVYSEWPLGTGLEEAADLTRRAEAAGVRTVIGLQGQYASEIRHARDLIHDGYIGKVLGTTLVGSGMVWGPDVDRHGNAYRFDRSSGASALTSATLHALDALFFTLGDPTSLAANLITAREQVKVTEDGSMLPVTAPDQIAVIGTLAGGAALSAFYRGGASRGANYRWEINGSEGDLVLSSSWGNMQVADLTLEGARGDEPAVRRIEVPESYTADIPAEVTGRARNVAQVYLDLARDLREGTHTVPGFAHALARHRLIDTIERASATGRTQRLG